MANEAAKLSEQCAINMKRVLKCGKDVSQYYRLLSMLEFDDMKQELKTRSCMSIVNDLIANKKL